MSDGHLPGTARGTVARRHPKSYAQTLAMSVAAKTSRIRIGTSVICAPFHNPLRLAEDIAAVDIAFNGRFDLGIGVGPQWEEFNTFGSTQGNGSGAPGKSSTSSSAALTPATSGSTSRAAGR
jgi:alkanesulfonate monooxygenase SsuD/methylene tetrahydromethanopterin reductase-like flavin-dependent oxidoreductase (luciferase family)